jgi:hypothetical protein
MVSSFQYHDVKPQKSLLTLDVSNITKRYNQKALRGNTSFHIDLSRLRKETSAIRTVYEYFATTVQGSCEVSERNW